PHRRPERRDEDGRPAWDGNVLHVSIGISQRLSLGGERFAADTGAANDVGSARRAHGRHRCTDRVRSVIRLVAGAMSDWNPTLPGWRSIGPATPRPSGEEAWRPRAK